MKITNKLIAEKANDSAKDTIYLNLSGFSIAQIENLDQCSNLRHLLLRNNELDCLIGLEKCRQMWRLDVNNNRIKNLDGFTKFVAIGTLNLHGNEFNWTELEKIRHLHIVDLCMSNNPKLDKDPQYRIHLIDCLPNVWMIDGLLVTSAERLEVANFFDESALSSKPVRRKLPKYQFIPTDQKKRDIFGDWSTKLLSKFAVNEIKNIETDLRRLEFIAHWFEDIIQNDCLHIKETTNSHNSRRNYNSILNKSFLKSLIDFRKSHTEMCNMILVLLVASLEFKIPTEFLNETLIYTNLNKINDSYETIQLFELPRISKIYISNLLLSAVKIDRDQNIETGFYENLFVALRNLLCELFRSSNNNLTLADTNSNESNNNENTLDQLPNVNRATIKDNKALLSTEIIQLFCIVPTFYDFLSESEGLISILNLSIGDSRMYLAIQTLLEDSRRLNKSSNQICEELGSFITNLLKLNARQLLNKKSKRKKPGTSNILSPSQTPDSLDVHGTSAHIQNITLTRSSVKSASTVRSLQSPCAHNRKSASREAVHRIHSPINANNTINEEYKRAPSIDESLIIARNKIGKVIKLEKENFVQVKFDTLADLIEIQDYHNTIQNSLYIDIKYFEWDASKNYWRPNKSSGDINNFTYDGDMKNFLIKPTDEILAESSPSTARANNLINLNIFNQLDTHNDNENNGSHIAKNSNTTNMDSNRSILSVNLDKNESRNQNQQDSSSVSSSTTRNNGKMVHFMLDVETDNSSPLSYRINSKGVQFLPSRSQSPITSKNFPGNKLTAQPRTRSAMGRNNRGIRPDRPLSASNRSTNRNSEFVQKWNDDEPNTALASTRLNHPYQTNEVLMNSKNDTKNVHVNVLPNEKQNINFYNDMIEPLNENNSTTNLLVNSIELLNQHENSFNDHDHLNGHHHHHHHHVYNEQKNFKCVQCDGSKNMNSPNITINMDKTSLLAGPVSRPSSPQIPKGPTSSTITLIQPAINNLNIINIPNKLTVNNFYYQNYQNYLNPTMPSHLINKKQFIKLQDCTTWLTLSSNRKVLSPTQVLNSSKNRANASNLSRAETNDRSSPNYFPGTKLIDTNINRISLLLNRKTNRANTNPKTPILTSPSSKEHMLYKGLRPNNINNAKEINLITKKIDVPNNSLIKN